MVPRGDFGMCAIRIYLNNQTNRDVRSMLLHVETFEDGRGKLEMLSVQFLDAGGRRDAEIHRLECLAKPEKIVVREASLCNFGTGIVRTPNCGLRFTAIQVTSNRPDLLVPIEVARTLR